MYVDARFDKKLEKLQVVERVSGKRVFQTIDPDWHFYIDDPDGKDTTIYGTSVRRITPRSVAERGSLRNKFYQRQWESDVNVIHRCLEQKYPTGDAPRLNVTFFDIETAFDRKRGYAEPMDAFNPITAISLYNEWEDKLVCLAVPPRTLSLEEADKIASQVPNVYICETEKLLLSLFLKLIEDSDVLSGWNSELYDIPYTINRVTRMLGKQETRKFCLWNQLPAIRRFERFGREETTYDITGRLHLDYLELYKKYSYEEKPSYKLDSIAKAELNEHKVPYDGTLDQLYNRDFKKFLEYSLQDTLLLYQLDQKLQYIDLCNTLAHANCVLLPTTMGTVAMTDQAIMIEAHNNGLIVPNKKRHDANEDVRVAGAWVAEPQKGMHRDVGSVDLNSLYPATIRALNMSPETIVGQVNLDLTAATVKEWLGSSKKHTFANWWNDRFCPLEMNAFFDASSTEKIIVDFENGTHKSVTGAELREFVFRGEFPVCISANGTIFRNDVEGIIPKLLTRWYGERKLLQAAMRNCDLLVDNDTVTGIVIPAELFTNEEMDKNITAADEYDLDSTFNPDFLKKLISGQDKDGLIQYMSAHGLSVSGGHVIATDQAELSGIRNYWKKRQHVKKINLNAAYGSLLNVGSRFFDKRIGQSTTLTGRNITRHMAAKINEYITGEYAYNGKAILYGDTDSAYFSAYETLKPGIDAGEIDWSKDDVIALYDNMSNAVSDTLPNFALRTFNIPLSRSTGVLKAGREIVASSALFIKKKRYAAMVYDNEGVRNDVGGKPGKIKVTGLDLRRSDTPVFVQKFLMKILTQLLTGVSEEDIITDIKAFKKEFADMPPWEKGSPKAVNKLTYYQAQEAHVLAAKLMGVKIRFSMPGHVRASIYWNRLRDLHGDLESLPIRDGQKVRVCPLHSTADNSAVSIAYPADETRIPKWFTELPFDNESMLERIVDKKIQNLLGVLKWDLRRTKESTEIAESLFDFSGFKKA